MFWFIMAILLGYLGIYDMGFLITRMDATIWFSQIDDWPNLKTIAMLTFQKGICFRLKLQSTISLLNAPSGPPSGCTAPPSHATLLCPPLGWGVRFFCSIAISDPTCLGFFRFWGSYSMLQHSSEKQVFVPPQLCNSPPQSDWPSCRGWMKKLSAVVVLLIFPVTNEKTDWWDIFHAARGVHDIQQVPSAQIQHFQRQSLCFCCGTATRRSERDMATPFNAPRGRPIAMFDTGG